MGELESGGRAGYARLRTFGRNGKVVSMIDFKFGRRERAFVKACTSRAFERIKWCFRTMGDQNSKALPTSEDSYGVLGRHGLFFSQTSCSRSLGSKVVSSHTVF